MAKIPLQLLLIFWKNFIIRKRHCILSIFEILMPLLIFSMLSFVHIVSPEFKKVFIHEAQRHEVRYNSSIPIMLFTPNGPGENTFMKLVSNLDPPPTLHGFETNKEMEEWVEKYIDEHHNDTDFKVPVGVVFDDFDKNRQAALLKYSLRTDSQIQLDSLFDYAEPFHSYTKNDYFDDFISAQQAIEVAFSIDMHPKNRFDFINYQAMPYPPRTDTGKLTSLFVLLPVLIIFAFTFVFPSVLKRIIEEKSTGIKEYMKMMGLNTWMLWLGWFIHSMIINILVITIIVLILSVNMSENTRSIFEYTDPSIIWMFLFLYCSAGTCFCFFISSLFKKPTLGMCVGTMIWMVTHFFFFYLVMNDDPKMYKFYRYFVMIWPNVCLVYGIKAISEFELKETGLTWSNYMEIPNEYTPHPSMDFVFLMLMIDCIIFLILTWYIDNVFPGDYGIARPWYYPFTARIHTTLLLESLKRSYCCTNTVSHLANIEGRDWKGIETVAADRSVAIQIRNVSKSFRKKLVVDDLSFDIYENEITVLLGQNGTGKTTTMNIITGMVSPNSGTVIVNGLNIRRDIHKIRKSIGFCPQHNLQFSDLTALEHLMFFAMGLSITAAKLESEQFLARLNMSSKANKMASSLSGCMRRKLSLGMALVGHTRVLILDEPTSGLDPAARRQIWDLLLSMKGERTILITTHYMLEADILGDRIAVMHHGQLMCYGTSLFLKNYYGTGYTLSLLVTESLNIDKITEVIQNEIASATVKSISADFVTFALPTNDTEALSALFSNLEMNKTELSIFSFCVTLTTMEEVFLRVSEIAEEIDKLLTNECTCEPSRVLLTGPSLLCHQFLGLFIKRCQYACHRWIMFLLQVLIPLALIAIIMIISENATKPVDRTEMVLNPYTRSESFFSIPNKSPQTVRSMRNKYNILVKKQHGKVTAVISASDAIIKVGIDDINRYHHTLIASVAVDWFKIGSGIKDEEIDMYTFHVLYGNWALHGPPISLNLATNFVLKAGSKSNTAEMSVVNYPWPQFVPKFQIKLNMGVITTWIFLFPIAFTVLVGFFLLFIHGERLTGVKHLQLMTGVPRVLYWAVIYIFDLIVYFAVGTLAIIIIYTCDIGRAFINWPSLVALSLLMFLYGFAILPFSYIFTYTATTANSVLFLIWVHVLFGTLATAVVFSLEFLGDMYKEIGDGLTYVLHIFPPFSFSNGIYKYITHTSQIYYWDNLFILQKKDYCLFSTIPCCEPNSLECKEFYSYYAGEFSIIINLICLTAQIFLYFIILFLFDSGMPRKCYGKLLDLCYDKASVETALNQDVAEEQLRIQNQINGVTQRCNDVLQVTNLRKSFGNVHAVRGLNFGVKSKECVGLLGINGAGKTTTFKMLTGEICPTSGTANLMGYGLHSKRSKYLKNIGYCPQVDALNLTLTCREMLQLFAYLRGIPSRLIWRHVNKWINRFDIKQYENIRCGYLIGGDLRKLSTAVALIGNPPLVMLDEPTNGADPDAWRNLWIILAELRKSGSSIILTSHSVIQCEALCDRLAIMADGQIKCIGNNQYLRSKYGQGFTVMMKLKPFVAFNINVTDSVYEIAMLKRKIESNYCCTLKDEHIGVLLYHVSNRCATLGEIFLFLEELKSDVRILEGYTICDTSLEHVFVSYDLRRCKATANSPAAMI